MLETFNLTKKYSELTALDTLNLRVDAGELFCLLGANGAGKTTTINLLMGFIQPTSGEAKVNGVDVVKNPTETKKYVSYIPENLNLYTNLTGLENLQFFTGLSGLSPSKKELTQMLESVDLQKEAIHKRVSQYSKGMRQKVGIAIAKAKNASCLLLDEPTSGLDPEASNNFASLLAEMRDKGMAILMATHDLFRAKESGTHIGIMKSGELVHTLKSDEISLQDLEKLYLETMKSTLTYA